MENKEKHDPQIPPNFGELRWWNVITTNELG